ncbi:hypothetical protein ACFQFH_20010 [Halobaculum halobium]|uniref:Uncharacterized protein n=1 Tax=Halobaculum halobium TaxID=3032281 RepID=A0ABD5TEX4_9EURY|nr:hypothetical protein [Halobaculum sp. SYNS20]
MTEPDAVDDTDIPQSRIRCLGCGNIENSVKEHRRHMARADHLDHGETYL